MNTLVLPLLISVSFLKVVIDGQTDFATVFGITIGVLTFFTLLVRYLLKDKNASSSELSARTTTFWWMLALFQISVATNSTVFCGLMVIVAIAAFYEYRCFDSRPRNGRTIAVDGLCALLIPVCFVLSYRAQDTQAIMVALLFLLLVLPTLLVVENAPSGQLHRFGHLSSGILFFAIALPLAVVLFQKSVMVLLLCVFLTEFRDMSAYWMGKYTQRLLTTKTESTVLKWIRYPVAGHINQNKSWGIGFLSTGVLVLVAISFTGLVSRSLEHPVSPMFMVLWAIALGFFGLMGDLIFSMLKREFAIKDSGRILPGNTGIIDRIDALILTIPATYLLFNSVT